MSELEKKPEAGVVDGLVGLLRSKPQYRNVVLLTFVLIGVPLALGIVGAAWFMLLPRLWTWGFSELSFRALPAALAVFFVAFLPLVPFVFLFEIIGKVIAQYADIDANRVSEVVHRGSTEQASVEEELGRVDRSGLVLLLRYSRVQLEQYYAIGLTQTQRSFRYGVMAMWIGFSVILIGILIRVVDLEKFGLRAADDDASILVILSGTIIEVISALFLWLYRRSVTQLTYFYDRQMYNHSVLMCHRIAETMTAADEVKKSIVDKVLDKPWALQQDALPEGTKLLSFSKKPVGA